MINERRLTTQSEAEPTQEWIIDIAERHPVEKHYQEQFPDDAELQSLHLEMSLGIAARECRVAYVIKQSTGWLHGSDSQKDYLQLMRRVSEEGAQPDQAYLSEGQPWRRMFSTLNSLHDFLSPAQFKRYVDRLLDRQEQFINDPEKLTSKEIMKLRTLSHAVRTSSELLVIDYLTGDDWPDHDQTTQQERMTNIDNRLIREFTDQYYWRNGGGFSFLKEKERLELTNVAKNMIEIHTSALNDM